MARLGPFIRAPWKCTGAGNGQTRSPRLRPLCRRNRVRRLAVFGSLLGEKFTIDSDVDILVAFEDGAVPGLLGLSVMELELETELGRRVDLRTARDPSRYFRDEVQASAREIYAA